VEEILFMNFVNRDAINQNFKLTTS